MNRQSRPADGPRVGTIGAALLDFVCLNEFTPQAVLIDRLGRFALTLVHGTDVTPAYSDKPKAVGRKPMSRPTAGAPER